MTRRKVQFSKILQHFYRVVGPFTSRKLIINMPQALKFLSRIDFWILNFAHSSEKRSCHTFVSTPSLIILLLLMLEASGVFLVGLFLHENHVTSQLVMQHIAILWHGISASPWLKAITIVLKEYKKTTTCFYSS